MHSAEILGFPSRFFPVSLIWMFSSVGLPSHMTVRNLNVDQIPLGIHNAPQFIFRAALAWEQHWTGEQKPSVQSLESGKVTSGFLRGKTATLLWRLNNAVSISLLHKQQRPSFPIVQQILSKARSGCLKTKLSWLWVWYVLYLTTLHLHKAGHWSPGLKTSAGLGCESEARRLSSTFLQS